MINPCPSEQSTDKYYSLQPSSLRQRAVTHLLVPSLPVLHLAFLGAICRRETNQCRGWRQTKTVYEAHAWQRQFFTSRVKKGRVEEMRSKNIPSTKKNIEDTLDFPVHPTCQDRRRCQKATKRSTALYDNGPHTGIVSKHWQQTNAAMFVPITKRQVSWSSSFLGYHHHHHRRRHHRHHHHHHHPG